MLVYFLEYTITTCFADKISDKIKNLNPDKKDEYLYTNFYTIFAFCY